MDALTARLLTRLTSDFYGQVAPSFSATRQAPWPGWQRLLEEMGPLPHGSLRVLDLACGNLRFERFLAERLVSDTLSKHSVVVRAVDSCDALACSVLPSGIDIEYVHLDIAEALYGEHDLANYLGRGTFDLAVCFGYLHHLALPEHRTRVLKALVESLAPGGIAAVSLWQLSQSERLLAKAQATTAQAVEVLGFHGLEAGDYLLGWQGRTDVLRYCHDFSESEIDELARAVSPLAHETTRFSADGATGNLNRYLVLRRVSTSL